MTIARNEDEKAKKIRDSLLGIDCVDLADNAYVGNMGMFWEAKRYLKEAGDYYQRALKIDEKNYGPDHPNVARDVNNIGSILQSQGDFEGARAHFKMALDISEKAYGADHPNTKIMRENFESVKNQ